MKIAMLGGGMVGQTLAGKLLSNGHEVTIGIRSAAAANCQSRGTSPTR